MKNRHTAPRRREPPMSLELIGLLEHRRVEFERKFGRQPQAGDPLFFDPDADEPRRMPKDLAKDAQRAVVSLTGLSEKIAAGLVARW